ncbi:MAG: pilus assembly protein PilM [Alphaproteobacteria bacterium]|nr:pilus assembly protein PilM [Alphaproteobacteria bacterium]
MTIVDSLKNILHVGKKESVLGIDVGTSAIKIVQLHQSSDGPVLDTYGSLALGPQVEEKKIAIGESVPITVSLIKKSLSYLMRESKTTATVFGFSLPFRSSYVKQITVPQMSDESLREVIDIEANKHIPVPLQDVTFEWFPVPELFSDIEENQLTTVGGRDTPLLEKKNTDTRTLVLSVVENTTLNLYKSIASELQMLNPRFEIEIFSALRSTTKETHAPTLIIDIGARTTKFYIVLHSIVFRSFFIDQGGETLTHVIMNSEKIAFQDAELKKREYGLEHPHEELRESMNAIIDNLISEININMQDFESHYHHAIGRVVLTGGGSTLGGLYQKIKENIPVAVEYANPFLYVAHQKNVNDILQKVGPEFSVAIGIAMRMLQK